MPEIKVDITGETGQIKEAITEVKDAVRDASENIKKNAASAGESADSFAKKAAKNWKNAAKDTKGIGDKAKDSAGKISAAGGALSAMGASIGQQFGAAGQMISSLASGPVGILTAAIGAAVSVGMKLWDQFTLSAEEALLKTAAAVEKANLAKEKAEKNYSSSSGYIDRLAELAAKEKLSNAGKKEAALLIELLEKKYGNLGISIDKATGKIKGLEKAQKAFEEESKDSRIAALKKQMRAYDMDRDAEFKKMMDTDDGWYFKTFEKSLKYMKQLSVPQQIAYAERGYAGAKSKDTIEFWGRILKILRKRNELTQEYISLTNKGALNDQEAAAKAKKETDKEIKNSAPFSELDLSVEREKESIQLRLANRREELAIVQKIAEIENKLGRKLTAEESEKVKEKVKDLFLKKQEEALVYEMRPVLDSYFKKEVVTEPVSYEALKEAEINKNIKNAERKHGRLDEEGREYVARHTGRAMDFKLKQEAADRTRELKQQLKLKQLELQGLTKEAALQREIFAMEKQKGRLLTAQEKNDIKTKIYTMADLDAVGKSKQSALGYYAQFQQDSPYQNDQLIQMGAKVNAVTHIDWQAKNHEVLKTISKSVETIVQRANAPAGISNGGTFI